MPRTRKRAVLAWLVIALGGVFFTIQPLYAQGDQDESNACWPLVRAALETVETACDEIGRNRACYGHGLVDIERRPGVEIVFATPGDLVSLLDISALHTAALDVEAEAWGLAVISAQADLPETMPGQNVTFLLMGEVTVMDAAEDPDEAPIQSFYFTGDDGSITCDAAPNALVIQNPSGASVTLNVNGVEVALASTAVFYATPGDVLDILLVGGEAVVTAQGVSETVPAGQQTAIDLGGPDGLMAISPPHTPQALAWQRIQGIPFNLLPEHVAVSISTSWTDTGIIVRAGQSFTIGAAGLMNSCSYADCRYYGWWSPAGEPVDEDCPFREATGSNCRCEQEECQLFGAPYSALLARVGAGRPFVVGVGGTFTAETGGTLQLGINDTNFRDNAGGYTAIITVAEASGEPGAADAGATCFISATGGVNARTGPGTTFAVQSSLASRISAEVDGQTTDSDGFVWWRLTGGAWVRSDVVSEVGDCESVPVLP